jgi:predicted nucleic acid-binding protein
MAREVFVDSSGLYALSDHRDPLQKKTRGCVTQLVRTGTVLIVTDYVVDEACTLAKTRAGAYGAMRLLNIVERSDAFRMAWIGEERFTATKAYFRKHADHGYSFTDCSSFVVMRELGISDALTTDRHFVAAGFRSLLLPSK